MQDRIVSNSDYVRNNLLFQPKGLSNNWYDTSRMDYNITAKHVAATRLHLHGEQVLARHHQQRGADFPGTGAVIGADNLIPSQGGVRYAVAGALRSSITPRLTNELRFGINRAVTIFRGEVSSAALFSEWKGYCPTLGFSLTAVASVCGSSRRSLAGARTARYHVQAEGNAHHHLRRGRLADQSLVPDGRHQRDSHHLLQRAGHRRSGQYRRHRAFSPPTNFPGAPSTQLTDAAALYALLTGRVASIGRSVAYDGSSYKTVAAHRARPPVRMGRLRARLLARYVRT